MESFVFKLVLDESLLIFVCNEIAAFYPFSYVFFACTLNFTIVSLVIAFFKDDQYRSSSSCVIITPNLNVFSRVLYAAHRGPIHFQIIDRFDGGVEYWCLGSNITVLEVFSLAVLPLQFLPHERFVLCPRLLVELQVANLRGNLQHGLVESCDGCCDHELVVETKLVDVIKVRLLLPSLDLEIT